jgi:hypothetical protein
MANVQIVGVARFVVAGCWFQVIGLMAEFSN